MMVCRISFGFRQLVGQQLQFKAMVYLYSAIQTQGQSQRGFRDIEMPLKFTVL